MYLSQYNLQWKKCCDPLAKRKKTVKTGLVSISLLPANKWALSSGKTLISLRSEDLARMLALATRLEY